MMTAQLVSEVQYPDRNPPEIHYLYVDRSESGYLFRAGEVIGKGVAAGGGEGTFTVDAFRNRRGYERFLKDIQCEWIQDILDNPGLADNEKFLAILDHCNRQTTSQ